MLCPFCMLGRQSRRADKSYKMAPWLNWIEQPPPKGQVAGSNPAGVATATDITGTNGSAASRVSETACVS